MKYKLLLTAASALFLSQGAAHADTYVKKTITSSVERENVREIQFSKFDMNENGLYSRQEVGEKLFYVFDRDGNRVIDNNEWAQKSLYTLAPMEKETYKFIDENDDGYIDQSSYTLETFLTETGLSRFDANNDGLSPEEFIKVESFQQLDDSDNNIIELDEWREAYSNYLRPANAEAERYN